MNRHLTLMLAVGLCGAIGTAILHGQGRGGAEWTTSGYDAQRTASIKADPRISVQTMQKPGDFGAFKFLWKLKLEYDPKAATALTQPILLDRIIGFRGFKSIAFVGTQSETVHAIDIDLGTPLWKYHINYSASPPPIWNATADCPGGLVASLSRPTAVAPPVGGGGGFGGGRGGRSGSGVGEPGMGAVTLATAGQQRGGGPGGPGGRGAGRGAAPGSAAAAAGNAPGGLPPGARAGGGGFGGGPFVPGNDAAYVVGSDGFLHALNVQNGVDLMPPTLFVPANTRVAGLLIANLGAGDTVAYVATTHGCGGQPDGVWAMELGADSKKDVVAFQPKDVKIAGSGGVTLGRDGTVYVTTAGGSSPMSNQLIALESKTLKQKAAASVAGANFNSSPLVFSQNEKDVIAALGGGKLYLFDSASLASGPVATMAVAGSEKLESTALASWEDAQTTRWIAAPTARGIVTFKVADENGKLALQPEWTSRYIASPLPPLVVNGVMFAASSGTKAVPSVLYAIDASTGKELWSSLRTITTSVRNGLSAGQGNVYVPGADGTLYAFGFAIEK